jgi:hypothetical protein
MVLRGVPTSDGELCAVRGRKGFGTGVRKPVGKYSDASPRRYCHSGRKREHVDDDEAPVLFAQHLRPSWSPLETHCCRALAEVSTDELFDHGDSLAAGDSLGSDRFGTDGQVSKEVRLHRDAYLSKNDAK